MVLSVSASSETEPKEIGAEEMSCKTQWPELVGKTFEEAKTAILQDKPTLNVLSVPEGSMVTMDWREDRVRVYVDDNNVVKTTPSVG